MATKISDIPNLERQISNLEKERGTYEEKLSSSPTAFGGSEPTSSDVYNQESLQRIKGEIQTLNDNILRAKWYPESGQELNKTQVGEEAQKPGLLMQGLDILTRPLYGIVGATKHAIGQGSDSMYQDIADNMMRNKNTFGDVLKTSGLPGAVSAPLGFALDIAMDPVNWATMGGGALVPRLGIGAVKGFRTGESITKGIGLAAKSGVLEKAATVGRYTPFLRKTETFANLGKKAIEASEAYNLMAGSTAADIVVKRGLGVGKYRYGLGEVIKDVATKIPGGSKILENFVYDPVEWVRNARIKDIFQQSLGAGVDVKGVVNATIKGEPIEPFMKEAAGQVVSKVEATEFTPGKIPLDTELKTDASVNIMNPKETGQAVSKLLNTGLSEKVTQEAPKIVNAVDDTTDILKNQIETRTGDAVESALRIANEKIGGTAITLEDVAKIVNSGALDQSGVKWFDNMMKGIRDWTIKVDRNSGKVAEVGKKTLKWYEQGMAVFKVAKVAASPTAWVNAVVGNLVMTHMAGGSISPMFIQRLYQSQGLLRNKTGKQAYFDGLLALGVAGKGEDIGKFFGDYSTAVRGTLGNTSFVRDISRGRKGAAEYVSAASKELELAGNDLGIAVKAKDIENETADAMGELNLHHDQVIAKVESEFGKAKKEILSPTESGVALTKKAIAEKGFEKLTASDLSSGYISQELFNSKVSAEMFKFIEEKAKANPGNVAYRILNFTFNKMPEGYEKIDQTFKWATFLTAYVDGYSMNELKRISKLIDINPEEIREVIVGGQKRYALSPRTALELGNVMYLNYAAMPAAIKVLRNFPILSSPFVSFMYGMSLKTAQTLAYNPSAFNKVTFAMNEFGGSKTPLEKKALDDPKGYYSYLKQPGMYRLPTSFFEDNPAYLNMTNMIPYYSLNMFTPSKTQYGSSVREQLVQTFQNSPIMKDPVGSVLFDFMIQPLILGEAINPQGQFGQPLYPIDASWLEKAGYGARTLGEAFVPNIYNYAGLLTPEAAAEYVPSYRWRQLSRAKAGKNQLGISSKESVASRVFRGAAQTSGIPLQAPVNTTFVKEQK
jgi:hypothetical protein